MSEPTAAPASAGGRSVRVELDQELSRQIEDWRRRQPTIPSTAETVRRLVARALANDTSNCVAA